MQPIQDTIEFDLSAETVVTNTTVKVTATIVGIITPEMTETNLKEKIRDMMKNFIADATWQFSGMTRNSHRSGMEEITLTATARVAETENYALDRRSREVSVEGMSITNVAVDTTPPASMIEDAEASLRLTLLDKAEKQRTAINAHLGADYRLSHVAFGDSSDPFQSPKNMRNAGATMMAMTANSANYGSGFGGSVGGDTIGNAVKLSMDASVTLSVLVSGKSMDPELAEVTRLAGIK